VQVKGPVTIDGPAAPIRCETPIDRFPPVAPGGLLAVPGGDGTVELTWDPVSAKDVAGYVVLRSGGGGDTLLRLTKRMLDLHYTDGDVTRGTTYSYAVVAEDARGNVSAPSATQSVTVRMPCMVRVYRIDHGGCSTEICSAISATALKSRPRAFVCSRR
jgi:hypothetical protein